MTAILDSPIAHEFWTQWGPLGAIVAVQAAALAWVGRWLLQRSENTERALLQLLEKTASTSERTAVLLSALEERIESTEVQLKTCLHHSSQAHQATHDLLQTLLKSKQR